MTTKKKAVGAGTRTAANTAYDGSNHTATDPLILLSFVLPGFAAGKEGGGNDE